MNQKGFTLLEITIVMLLLSIVTVYAVTRWPNSIDLDAQAEQLAQDIRLIQSLSMNRHQRFRITFSANQYQLFDGSSTPYPHPATDNATIPLTPGITLTTTDNNIIFDSLGEPYNGAPPGVALGANASITLTDTVGETKQITVTPETGNVSIQ